MTFLLSFHKKILLRVYFLTLLGWVIFLFFESYLPPPPSKEHNLFFSFCLYFFFLWSVCFYSCLFWGSYASLCVCLFLRFSVFRGLFSLSFRFLCLSDSVLLLFYLYVFLTFFPSFLSVFISFSYQCFSVFLSICLSICLSVHRSFYLSLFLFLSLSMRAKNMMIY